MFYYRHRENHIKSTNIQHFSIKTQRFSTKINIFNKKSTFSQQKVNIWSTKMCDFQHKSTKRVQVRVREGLDRALECELGLLYRLKRRLQTLNFKFDSRVQSTRSTYSAQAHTQKMYISSLIFFFF